MDKKKKLYIAVIIVLLGATAYMIVTNFLLTAKPAAVSVRPVDQTGIAAGGSTVLQVLPFGDKLEFGLVKKYNPDSRVYNYPQLDVSQVGIPPQQLITPPTK